MKNVLRYAGGKTKAIKQLTPFVKNVDKIVSPFIGGGSLEVYWASELNKEVIGYDLFDVLVNFWEILLSNPRELANELSKINPNIEEYNKIKEILLSLDKTQEMIKNVSSDHYKRKSTITLDNLTLAAYYYFNHNCSYGPGYLGWASNLYLDKGSWNKMIERISNFKCDNLTVKQATFEESIPKHKNDFLYLDPPYYLGKDKDNKMYKGIYPVKHLDVHHSGFNHELLRDLLKDHKGGFLLSYNNCETIREYYDGYEFHYPEWNYSMGNGEKRVGKFRKENNEGKVVKKSHEILIYSPPK